jgi:flagellar biosynthesis protein FlhB
LREARKRGQVAKSQEVNSFVILTAGLAMAYIAGERMIAGQLSLSRSLLSSAHRVNLEPATVLAWMKSLTSGLFDVYWPLIGLIMLVGIMASVLQTGPVFSFFPLKPDVKRINPVEGFKRLFSMKLLFEAFKSILKTLLFGSVVYFVVVALMPKLLMLVGINPDHYASFLLDSARGMIFKLLLVLLLVAAADVAYTRWDFSKKMRMSRREIKDEVKRREGDPQIRAKRRELQKEAVKRAGSLSKVPEADVLITNPTHLAVALKYERGTMIAPQVIAKGAGELAARMKLIAREHRVPVVENKSLARKLFRKVALEQGIPEALYPAVAKILVWVFALREQHRTAR